jgi:hypothetical protein
MEKGAEHNQIPRLFMPSNVEGRNGGLAVTQRFPDGCLTPCLRIESPSWHLKQL